VVEIVVKVGGALLAHRDHFDAVLEAIGTARRERRVLVVPGGGPFADAVRDVDRRLRLSAAAAHWMAVLAMDQYAHLIADRLAGGVVVVDRQAVETALEARRVPVLAPFRWMREADPLPHDWGVTSDSIAAWIAGATGARQLVLVKPPGARDGKTDAELVDAHFGRAIPVGVTPVVVAAEQTELLRRAVGLKQASKTGPARQLFD
jgi:5-(aminomethyl)-3-furanmethanol phosphate kinase